MRTPGTCLPKGKGEGEDTDKLLCRLKRTQEEGPGLLEASSWMKEPAVDNRGNSQNGMLSLEMKSDPSEAVLVLHDGNKVFPYSEESVRRNSTSAVAQSKTVDLFLAPAEECFAGVSCAVQEAVRRDWLEGGPRATDSHRRQCCKGEPCGSGLRCRQKPSERGTSEDEPPSAFLKGRASESKPACLHSVLSTLPHARPHVFPGDQTEYVSSGHSKPMFSEQTVEYKKKPPSVPSTSNDPPIPLRLLTLQAVEVAKPLCHN